MYARTVSSLICIAVASGLSSAQDDSSTPPGPGITLVAADSSQWTGIAVSPGGRIFVCFPRWSPSTEVSVAEVLPEQGGLLPFPDRSWQDWSPGSDPESLFVSVQSVYFCSRGYLWVLDTGNPWLTGVEEGAARLFRFDLDSGNADAVYCYDYPEIHGGSYLNDVRIDNDSRTAYLTDSGDGALIVTDLDTGESRRLLDNHPSTGAEDIVISPGGIPWVLPGGGSPAIHSDGIALSPGGENLYYHALTGRTLYRIATGSLLDPSIDSQVLAGLVEAVIETGPVDGMLFGPDGTLYLTLLEENAIGSIEPGSDSVRILASDDRIRWPDSFALGQDGTLYFTTSQIHLGPQPSEPYTILAVPAR